MSSAVDRWAELVGNRGGRGRGAGGSGGGPRGMAERLRDDPNHDLTGSPVFGAVMAGLGPERTVLDIGAGAGRYTLPLARAGCRVWALEPGEAMREHLVADQAQLPGEAAGRVTVVEGTWPEARESVPAVEVALASLVIHFCADAAGFLRAMEGAATRRCVLAIREGQMNPLAEALWPRLHPDRPFPRQPVLADLQAVLDEVGIAADVRVHTSVRAYGRYASREEAGRQLAGALGLEEEGELARLGEALDELLVPAAEGGTEVAQPVREALVTWVPGVAG